MRNVLAGLLLTMEASNQLPTIIPEHSQPFALEAPRWLRADEWSRVRQTVSEIASAMLLTKTVNPVTAKHLAEHIVGMHKRLLDGRIKLTPRLVEQTLKGVGVTGTRRRERTARRLLAAQLVPTYDLLERWAA
jgi:hypothetical protein